MKKLKELKDKILWKLLSWDVKLEIANYLQDKFDEGYTQRMKDENK